MKGFIRIHLIIFFIILLMVPVQPGSAEQLNAKAVDNSLKKLEKNASDSQVKTLDLIDTVADNITKKLEARKKDLQNDSGLNENLDVSASSISDIEKTRKRLKRDIKEWTELIDYTEMDEIKKGVADALTVAEADGLNVEKLTLIYNLTKKIIRNAKFRSAGTTAKERLENIDLDRAEIDQRLKELESKKALLQEQIDNTSYINIWTRESLKMELAGVEFEILQHRLGVRHEDISQPLYILMDGLFAGLMSLSRLTEKGREDIKKAGLEDYGFDWDAPRELAENYTLKLVSLGFDGEAMAAEAAAARQKYRKNLYKRSAIAFIRALISGRDVAGECAVKEMIPVTMDYNGQKVKVFGCPDPVVENLRAYLDSFRKFEDAEADRAIAEGEMLVAEQQIIADFMAAVPLVSDAIDIYTIYSGENLAGLKYSGIERGFMSIMAALPLVGPHAAKQIYKRYEDVLKPKMEILACSFRAIDEAFEALGTIKDRFPDEILEVYAKKMDIDVAQLKKMIPFFKDVPLDDAARARMKLFKTMRDAAEDRIVVHTLIGSEQLQGIYKRARQESDELFENFIRAHQGQGNFESFIPKKHRDAFIEVAKEKRTAVVMRPVGRDAAELLEKNLAGTKGLNIKPKSSNWGPHKAYIPVEQKFSKLGKPGRSIDLDEIGKYNAKAKACLDKVPPCSNTVPLEVPIPNEPVKVEVVIVKKEGYEIPVYRNRSGELIDPDTMKPIKSGDVDVSEIRPMEVFADEHGNPLTADYDLLAVGKKREAHTASAARGAGYDASPGRQTPRNAGNKGTITDEVNEVVDALNGAGREKAGYTKGNLVHHGPETFNPGSEGVFTASEMGDGLALTVFDPDYGELAIPACTEGYMKNWCVRTGMCNPEKICSKNLTTGCIPVDPDRVLKDYFHNARLRGIDISPHSSWNWGNYNGLGGWTQTGFLGVPAGVAVEAKGSFRKALDTEWQEKVASSVYKMMSIQAASTLGGEGEEHELQD